MKKIKQKKKVWRKKYERNKFTLFLHSDVNCSMIGWAYKNVGKNAIIASGILEVNINANHTSIDHFLILPNE